MLLEPSRLVRSLDADYLTKPLDIAKFFTVLDEALEQKTETEDAGIEPPKKTACIPNPPDR